MDSLNENGPLINFLFTYGPVIFLLLLGLLVGRIIERRHLKSLGTREHAMRLAVPTNLRTLPAGDVQSSFLVAESVVVASDYFKTFIASLKNLVGGRLTSYESLLERARREAIMRIREEAARYGAQMIMNIRFETSTIDRPGLPAIEVLAYGTAVVLAPQEKQTENESVSRAVQREMKTPA